MSEDLPQRLRRLLNERHYGKSESAWAREAGVDFNTLRNALEGKTKPRYPTMVKLAAYLDVSYEYLETGEGDSEPPPADLEATKAKVDEAMRLLSQALKELDSQMGDGKA